MPSRVKHLTLILACLSAALPSAAADPLPGPIPADVLSVYDGDTFTARAHIWPGHYVETSVRVLGIDTPEIRGECQREKDLAVMARDRARELLGATVSLRQVEPDKYGGRVDAYVTLGDGRDLAETLLSEGLGRPYDGGKRKSWCN